MKGFLVRVERTLTVVNGRPEFERYNRLVGKLATAGQAVRGIRGVGRGGERWITLTDRLERAQLASSRTSPQTRRPTTPTNSPLVDPSLPHDINQDARKDLYLNILTRPFPPPYSFSASRNSSLSSTAGVGIALADKRSPGYEAISHILRSRIGIGE